MTKISRLTALAFSTFLFAAPAAGSVFVLGDSPAASCYESARAREVSAEALGNCDVAIESEALTKRDQVATYVNRGVIKLVGNRYDDAIADFDRAIALDPNEAEAYLNKGSALLRKNSSTAQAISLLNQALERNTRRPEIAYYTRAIAHEESGNVRAAYYDYQRAQEAAPRWSLPARELKRFQVRPAGSTKL